MKGWKAANAWEAVQSIIGIEYDAITTHTECHIRHGYYPDQAKALHKQLEAGNIDLPTYYRRLKELDEECNRLIDEARKSGEPTFKRRETSFRI